MTMRGSTSRFLPCHFPFWAALILFFSLAISHALETTVLNSVPCRVEKHEGLANPNPYVLPWIMRGLLEEEVVKTELSAETAELLRQFDDWKPVTKALKDIKFRLEAVRSKL